MELPPPHVLLQLDAIIVAQRESADDDADAAFDIESSATSFSEPVEDVSGGARTTSRFWGVTWHREKKKWQARYRDTNGKDRSVGYYDDEEEAARAVNKAISDAGLGGKRRKNVVDATGALVGTWCRGRERRSATGPPRYASAAATSRPPPRHRRAPAARAARSTSTTSSSTTTTRASSWSRTTKTAGTRQ